MTARRVHTEGNQEGPCPVCGATGDRMPDGTWGGGWTGSDTPGFTHAVCWNREHGIADGWQPGDRSVGHGAVQRGMGL